MNLNNSSRGHEHRFIQLATRVDSYTHSFFPSTICMWKGYLMKLHHQNHCFNLRTVYVIIYLSISIYKAEILSVCLSVTLLTRLGLSTSPYQLLKTINSSSFSFKFVTTSRCSDELAFYSRLKTKKWRKLEQQP